MDAAARQSLIARYRPDRRRGLRLAALLVLATAAPAGRAAAPATQYVYVSTGAHGETSFSDVADPGAERLELDVPAASPDALAEMERRIARNLAVANDLEASRLAREQARAEARAAAAAGRSQSAPQVYDDGYDYPYVLQPYYRPPHRPGRPGHGPGGRPDRPEPGPPPERTVSVPFPYAPR